MNHSASAYPTYQMKRFTVITSDMMKQEDRANILALLTDVRNGTNARAKAMQKGFTTDVLDNHGRVVVLRWKGMEVALLFKRATHTVEIAPAEPTPSVHINDHEQAWVVFNLLGINYNQELQALTERATAAELALARTRSFITTVQQENEQKGNVLIELEQKIAALETELETYHTAEKKSRTLPDGRQLLVRVKYKTRTKIIQAPAPIKKIVKKTAPAKATAKTTKKPVKKVAKKKGKRP